MITLSSAIITFNEERNIARCLDSLKGIADEIVVVDSGSTDRTKEICNSYGVKFIQHPFVVMGNKKILPLRIALSIT